MSPICWTIGWSPKLFQIGWWASHREKIWTCSKPPTSHRPRHAPEARQAQAALHRREVPNEVTGHGDVAHGARLLRNSEIHWGSEGGFKAIWCFIWGCQWGLSMGYHRGVFMRFWVALWNSIFVCCIINCFFLNGVWIEIILVYYRICNSPTMEINDLGLKMARRSQRSYLNKPDMG